MMETTEEKRDRLVKKEADRLRKMLVGGQLYGKIITADDVDFLLVAAFEWGKQQYVVARFRELEDWTD